MEKMCIEEKRHYLPTRQEKEFSYIIVTIRLKKKQQPQLLSLFKYNVEMIFE